MGAHDARAARARVALRAEIHLRLGLKENSPVQTPERLYKERGFFLYTLFTFVLFVLAMFVKIPALYSWFNLDQAKIPALWVFG